MQKLMRIAALVLIAFLSIAGTSIPNAMAQDEEVGAFDDPTQLEGLEIAGGRSFSINYEKLMADVTPDASGGFAYPEGVQGLFSGIYKFDNDDNAKKALDKAREQFEKEGIEGTEFEEIEVDDLNDDTIALSGTTEQEGVGTTNTTVIATQEDEYLYLAIGISIGADVDVTGKTIELINYEIDEDAGDDDVSFNADGTSQGGIWDKFPAAGDDLVKDLVANDQQIFPVPEGE